MTIRIDERERSRSAGGVPTSLRDLLDPATGLPGETMFYECLASELDRASRYGESLGVLLIEGDVRGQLPDDDLDTLSAAWGQALPGLLRRMDHAFGLGRLAMGVILPHCPEQGLCARGDALMAHFVNLRSLVLADSPAGQVIPRAGAAVYQRGESMAFLLEQAMAGLTTAQTQDIRKVMLQRHPLPEDTS
ncbi:MAG: diguanylate cyclase [Aquisalimonadaceae bacterium]